MTTDDSGRVMVLSLHNRNLSGEIPSALGNLTNLEQLDLSGNQVCAPIDDAFQTWLEGINSKEGVVNCE